MAAEVLECLRDIQANAFRHAAPLPLKTDVKPEWQGIGYQIGGLRLVSSFDDVAEILQMPRITPLPGTKKWVVGVANIRGRLLPIMDVHRFLGLTPTLPRVDWRLVVIEDGDVVVGLVVELSLGMQYFVQESFEDLRPEEVPAVRPFIKGAYRHGGRLFYIADLVALVRDEEFFDVASK